MQQCKRFLTLCMSMISRLVIEHVIDKPVSAIMATPYGFFNQNVLCFTAKACCISVLRVASTSVLPSLALSVQTRRCICALIVVIAALINSSDVTMQFLLHNPIDALLAVEVSLDEYLLVFTSKSISRVVYSLRQLSQCLVCSKVSQVENCLLPCIDNYLIIQLCFTVVK